MTSRRVLLLLLLFVSVDFAVPWEPTTRGWYEYEDEEESVRPESRRAARPSDTGPRPAKVAVTRPRPASGGEPRVRAQHPSPVTRLARADTSSPPASPEAH